MSVDFFFWKQDGPREDRFPIEGRLHSDDNIQGLVKLPVEQIRDAIREKIGQDFLDSIMISAYGVSLDFLPEEEFDTLIQIMADYECPLFDPQMGIRYDGNNDAAEAANRQDAATGSTLEIPYDRARETVMGRVPSREEIVRNAQEAWTRMFELADEREKQHTWKSTAKGAIAYNADQPINPRRIAAPFVWLGGLLLLLLPILLAFQSHERKERERALQEELTRPPRKSLEMLRREAQQIEPFRSESLRQLRPPQADDDNS